MNANLTAGSELLYVLGHITNRDEAGRHFTETARGDHLETLEAMGLIAISRPVHQPSGIPYDQQYWHLEVTSEGQDIVTDTYDERDYEEGWLEMIQSHGRDS